MDNRYVTAAELAQLLGLSSETVYRLTRDRVFTNTTVPGECGKKYALAEALQAYMEKTSEGEQDSDLKRAKLETERLKQRKLTVEVNLAEGRAHPVEAVEAVMNDMLSSFRTRLRALPLDVAPKLGLTPEQTAMLARLVDDVLTVLSDYREEDFKARNPHFTNGSNSEE